jgi:hypothetical protein
MPSGGRRSLQESRKALGGVTTVGHPAELNGVTRVTGSQYAKAAGHISTGTNGGFAPRYYDATQHLGVDNPRWDTAPESRRRR